MKYFAVLAVFASAAVAQLGDIPSCALNCFIDALTTDGCSSLTDFACHCQKTELIGTVQPCLEGACSAAEISAVLTGVADTCEKAGHPISIPAASSVAASASAAVSSAASSAASAAASSVQSAAASSVLSAASSALSSVAAATSSRAASSSAAAASTSASAFTGAAARPTQVGALIAALGLAAVAL